MEFKYIGDCAAGSVTMYGLDFPKGVPTKVTEGEAVRKLKNNSHFEVVKNAVKQTGNSNSDSGKPEAIGNRQNLSPRNKSDNPIDFARLSITAANPKA